MGQYYKIVNRTKRQFIHPHRFNDGLKLCEFGASGGGTMFALALLLADGNGRGGGDAEPDAMIGTWAGDSISVAGDYANPEPGEERNLYAIASDEYEDVSDKMVPIVERES